MDTALVVITLLSVGLTGALLVYASRLQREQREREDARVLALASEIRLERRSPLRRQAFDVWEPGASRVGIRSTMRAAPVGSGLFAGDDGAPARRARRLVIPAVGAAIVGVFIGGVYLASARPAARRAGRATEPAPARSRRRLARARVARAGARTARR